MILLTDSMFELAQPCCTISVLTATPELGKKYLKSGIGKESLKSKTITITR
jgi:hypothetical protein